MLIENGKVSSRQVFILLLLDMFGTAALSLPRRAAEFGNNDGWIIILLSGVVALIYAYVIGSLVKLFPKESFVEFSCKIVTKPIGILLSLILLVKILIFAAIEVRIFGEIIKQTLLDKTPIEVIIMSMLLVCAYLMRKGYESRARMGEVLVFFVFVPVCLIFLLLFTEANFSNLKPFFTNSVSKMMEGVYIISFQYKALEIMLLATIFLNPIKKVTKVMIISVIVTTIFNLLGTILTVSVLGLAETKYQIWPIITLMKTFSFPGSLIERQELLFVVFWISSIFIILTGKLFFSSFIISRIGKLKHTNYIILLLVPIIYVLSLLPDSVIEAYDWLQTLFSYYDILYLLPIPLILLIIAKIRKLGVASEK